MSLRRPTVLDFMSSGNSNSLGICDGDIGGLVKFINSATQRLLYAREVGSTGFWGGWAEMAFEMDPDDPYLVTPYDVTMLEQLDVCTYPVPIQNEFYSYLRFGFGRFPKSCSTDGACSLMQGYDRGGFFPTWKDIGATNKKLRIYCTDAADEGKRVFVGGSDNNGQRIYSLDGTKQVKGRFYDLAVASGSPSFVDSVVMSKISGIQKDKTLGQVNFYQVDTVTGDAELILTMEPGETSASYRRYYIDQLPKNCCNGGDTVSVTAMAKLAYVPVEVATDYLLIPSIEALFNECQSVFFDRMHDGESKQKAVYHHKQAIGLLQGQLIHEQGKENVAVAFSPFGSAKLVNQSIGTLY
jgi:hypothetical protein